MAFVLCLLSGALNEIKPFLDHRHVDLFAEYYRRQGAVFPLQSVQGMRILRVFDSQQ